MVGYTAIKMILGGTMATHDPSATGVAVLDGSYGFNFVGFTRVPRDARDTSSTPYHIVGVGWMAFAADGTASGRQTSTLIAISGPGPTLRSSVFQLSAKYRLRPDNTGSLAVTFSRVMNPDTPQETVASEPEMSDAFEFVCVEGGNRLKFVSMNPTLLPENDRVDELVSAEAVRM